MFEKLKPASTEGKVHKKTGLLQVDGASNAPPSTAQWIYEASGRIQ